MNMEFLKRAENCFDIDKNEKWIRQYLSKLDVAVVITDTKICGDLKFYFYESKEFVESGNILHMLFGNSPIILNIKTGDIMQYPSSFTENDIVEDLESKGYL